MPKKAKPGRKPGQSIRFYTKDEDDLIRRTVTNGKTYKENAEFLAKKLKRTHGTILQRIVKIKKEMGISRTVNRAVKESKVDDLRSVVLPKNVALEFEASRAVLKENRIVIYFK